jgi:hypothetical protein
MALAKKNGKLKGKQPKVPVSSIKPGRLHHVLGDGVGSVVQAQGGQGSGMSTSR